MTADRALRRAVRIAVGSVSLALMAAGATTDPGTAAAPAATPFDPHHFVIGHSVDGRPLRAVRLSVSEDGANVVIIGSMHGDEHAGTHIVRSLVRAVESGRVVIRHVNLWVIPTINPDAYLRRTRVNSHGVDLNRNFPYAWTQLTGETYSGPYPRSEPETRALTTFLNHKRPRFVVSIHQPLYAVDSDVKNTHLGSRLSRYLGLPMSNLNCGGRCHGTMTGWYNHNHAGAAITIEFSGRPVLGAQAYRDALAIVRAELGRPVPANMMLGLR